MKTSWWLGAVGALILAAGFSGAFAQGPPEKKEESSAQKKKDENFTELRDRRNKMLSEIPKLEQEIQKLQYQKDDFARYTYQKQSYEQQIKRDKEQIASLQEALKVATPAEKKTLQEQLKKRESGLKYDEDQIESYKLKLNYSEAKVKSINDDLDKKQKEMARNRSELEAVETLISDMLDVMRPKQDFKYNMSKIFAVLVAIVIVGFFAISFYDLDVRRAIFSGTAGIQFVTLFSVVIAIILFGIIDILEGKELAALLGGLSGYILGRATSEKKT